MKKFFALLLAAMLVFAVVACEPVVDPEDPTDPDTPTVGGQVVIGDTTELTGDWTAYWINGAADNNVNSMMNGTGTVAQTQGGEYIWDPSVVAEQTTEMVPNEGRVLEDGTVVTWEDKVYTITLHEDLVWNNGDPITAKDFVATILLFSSPVIKAAGATGSAGMYYVGYSTYTSDETAEGHTKEFAGVRLLGDYQFSVTLNGDPNYGYLPYYYDIIYASIGPTHIASWMGEGFDVADDGNGAYFTGDFSVNNTALVGTDDEGNKTGSIITERFNSTDRVTCGAYNLTYYDVSAKEAVLEINPLYKGNFEGQKPYIQRVVYTLSDPSTQFDALQTGRIDVLTSLTDGAEINAALDIAAEGGFEVCDYLRNGYGKIVFQCDFGPTQFEAVRHAIAYLLDRNAFCETFTQGFGSVVHGPYGLAMWMYQESEEELADALNTYAYSLDSAIAALEGDGWVYNADGTDYSGTGTRYKLVTDEEAGNYPHVVEVNGQKYMALIIEWCSSTANEVSELIDTMLAKGEQTAAAGMVINRAIMDFGELLNYLYRDIGAGAQYGVPTYAMYNLATNFTAVYDMSYSWTLDPELVADGYNINYYFNEALDQASMDMVYGIEAGDNEAYRQKWVEYITIWNQGLPELPLYSNEYYDIYHEKIQNYEVNPLWSFTDQIIYCWVTE
ncbi:MAG: ABC transporter substrate-binding protein [Clostridia bacterium]|nr:ABC transporter substrate-binding protein [Clostridia bacterium]